MALPQVNSSSKLGVQGPCSPWLLLQGAPSLTSGLTFPKHIFVAVMLGV